MNCKLEMIAKSQVVSFVIPVYNEQDSLADLTREICSVCNTHGFNYSIYLINDGSTDSSGEIISELCRKNSRLKGVHLNHNSGKSAVYMAAFNLVTGDLIVTMDADLQDDPTELPSMLSALDESTDLVVGWKKNRFDNEPLKKIPSAVYNFLKGVLFGLHLHDSNSGYRVIRIKAARSLKLFGDRYRFIPELISMNGFNVKEQPVNHRPRMHGYSKYGSKRFVTGFFDLITVRYLTGYSQKPLHFFGSLSIMPLSLGFGLETYVLWRKLGGSLFQTHTAAITTGVMLIIVGFQLLAIGLVGEMIAGNRQDKNYMVSKIDDYTEVIEPESNQTVCD